MLGKGETVAYCLPWASGVRKRYDLKGGEWELGVDINADAWQGGDRRVLSPLGQRPDFQSILNRFIFNLLKFVVFCCEFWLHLGTPLLISFSAFPIPS